MQSAHGLLLGSLLVTAMPALGEEVDHSKMEHSHLDHASGREAAVETASHGGHGSDNAIHGYMLLDQLEIRDESRGSGFGWDMHGWIGTDLTRLWLRSEGEVASGHTEAGDLELLYGRSISTWWDLVAGLRRDFSEGESLTSGAIGIQGLAPQRIELAATLYLGHARRAARVSAEYEMLLTNRLVLQPRVEMDLYGKADAARSAGSGSVAAQGGLRLRYEINRQFAPYVGVNWDDSLRLVAGIRAWF